MKQPSQNKINYFEDAANNYEGQPSKGNVLEFFEQTRQLPMQAIGQFGNMTRGLHEVSKKVGQQTEAETPSIPGADYSYAPFPKLPTSEDIGEKIGYKEPTTAGGRYGKRIFGNIGGIAPYAAAAPLAAPALVGGAITGGLAGQTAKELHAPEWAAEGIDIATSLGTSGKKLMEKAVGKSGLTERFFVDAQKSHKISPEVFEKLHLNIEDESRKIADKMFSKNQTYEQIKKMPEKFYDDLEKGFEKVRKISKDSPLETNGQKIQQSILNNLSNKKFAPITKGEKGKAYLEQIERIHDEIPSKNFKLDDVIDQYRNNIKEMKGYFEPGKSGLTNEGKLDAMLDYNRSLSDEIHRVAPNSELDLLFKQTNKQFSDSKNIHKIDDYIDKLFPGKKVDYKKIQDYLKDSDLKDSVKMTFGKDIEKEFTQLLKDLHKQERGMKYLKPTESAKIKITQPSTWKNKFVSLFHGTPLQTMPKVKGGVAKLGAKLSPIGAEHISKEVGKRDDIGPSIDEVIAKGKKLSR
jgi:hypothetical protein